MGYFKILSRLLGVINPLNTIVFLVCSHAMFGQDTIRQHLLTMPNDSSRMVWLSSQINVVIYSEDSSAIVLTKLYDSLALTSKDSVYLARSKNFQGMVQYVQGNYETAAHLYLQSILLHEHLHSNPLEMVQVMNNLAACYSYRDDMEKSLEYYHRALDIAMDLQDTGQIAQINNNLGRVYMETVHLDKGLAHYDKAVNLYQLIGNQLYEGISLLGRGGLLVERKEYNKAIQDFEHAMELVPEQMIPLLHASAYAGIGTAYNRLRQTTIAKKYLMESLNKAEKIDHKEQLKESHRELSELFTNAGQYELALSHYKSYVDAKDSLYTEAQDRILMDALTKYESVKQEQEIQLLNIENENTNLKLRSSRRGLLGMAVITVLLAGLLTSLYFGLRNNIKKRTALEQKNEVIQDQNRKLIQLNADKNNLMSLVTHDLSSPLSTIKIWAQNLLPNSEVEDIQETKEAIITLTSNALSSINQSLINEGDLSQLTLEKISINQIIDQAMDNHQLQASKKQIRLINKLSTDNLILLTTDRQMLSRIVSNIVDNAIKYSYSGGEVWLSAEQYTDECMIAITDNGVGMGANQLAKVFDKNHFSAVKPTSEEPSHGVGLSHVKRLTEELGGVKKVNSTPGEGSTFTIILPK